MQSFNPNLQKSVMANRQYDYFYDNNYSVSNIHDHQKAIIKAQSHEVTIHPVFENMFSALGHFPQSQYRLKPDSLPQDIGQDRSIYYQPDKVIGTNRFKYFRRPIVPFTPRFPGQIVYARRPPSSNDNQDSMRPITPFNKNMGTQTIYRESDTQTDPYSPEYIIKSSKSPPELLALSTLKFGAGLPAGVAELEMIERARVKRAWEAALPKVTDHESFQIRLRMMEQMEIREWNDRENEIKKLQDARLAVLEKVLKKRQIENENIHNERIQIFWEHKLQERDTALQTIQKKKIKALRKLAAKRSKVENKIEKRDIIADYSNFGSNIYAPKARNGSSPDNKAPLLQNNIYEFNQYEALLELEKSFSNSVLEASVSIPKQGSDNRSGTARREFHLQQELNLVDRNLRERKIRAEEQEKPLKYAQKLDKPPVRPPTPILATSADGEEEYDNVALILQNLIRGRAVQNTMFLGKERRLTLINELRTRRNVEKMELSMPKEIQNLGVGFVSDADLSATPTIKEDELNKEKQVHEEAVNLLGQVSAIGDAYYEKIELDVEQSSPEAVVSEDAAVHDSVEKVEVFFESNVQAEYVGKTLDFLSKELVRLRQERKIAAMVMFAERTRKLREAQERGQREQELQCREQEDQIFKQMAGMHQETVDSYLEDIIIESTDRTSDEQARIEVARYAKQLNEIVDGVEQNGGGRMIVADLVSSFLIPQVEREMLREQILLQEGKYLVAAHHALHDTQDQEASGQNASEQKE